VPPEVKGTLARIRHVTLEVPSEISFGSALAMASRIASGDLLAKMDDDDLYSPHHVEDLVLGSMLSGADLVGKAAEFVYLEDDDATVHRFTVGGYSESRTIAGGALAVTSDAYRLAGGWRDVPRHVDQALIEDVIASGGRVFRTHGFGYVLVRHGDHTWSQEDRTFLDQAGDKWSGIPSWLLEPDPEVATPG
jgi:hypothetical protein